MLLIAMALAMPTVADDTPTSAPLTADTPTTPSVEVVAPAQAATDDRPTTGTPRIIVRWDIESAVDNYGYIILRSKEETGDYKPITRGVLPGVGTNADPHTLRYLDDTVEMDIVYYYKVEEVARDGSKKLFMDDETNTAKILKGAAKIMNDKDREMFAKSKFLIQRIERK